VMDRVGMPAAPLVVVFMLLMLRYPRAWPGRRGATWF